MTAHQHTSTPPVLSKDGLRAPWPLPTACWGQPCHHRPIRQGQAPPAPFILFTFGLPSQSHPSPSLHCSPPSLQLASREPPNLTGQTRTGPSSSTSPFLLSSLLILPHSTCSPATACKTWKPIISSLPHVFLKETTEPHYEVPPPCAGRTPPPSPPFRHPDSLTTTLYITNHLPHYTPPRQPHPIQHHYDRFVHHATHHQDHSDISRTLAILHLKPFSPPCALCRFGIPEGLPPCTRSFFPRSKTRLDYRRL